MVSRKLSNATKRHLHNNFILYFALAVIFITGIIIGSIISSKLNLEQSINISNRFNWIFGYMKDQDMKSVDVFLSSLLPNMTIIFIIWILGLVSIGIPVIPLLLCWKGVRVGFTVGLLVELFGLKGFTFSLLSLLPHYLIEIPCYLGIAAVGTSNSINLWRKRKSRVSNSSNSDYSMLMLLLSIIITITCLLDSILTSYILKITGLNLL
ncbi:stage II sporulation protein M [Tissierella sp.]|uniref:stage II sporulation protein M n=1 Tax=Tissierella sp. TaxID=41274 RepID=UPI002855DC07|nr:stage II sporulation protein M [Tissierella sp.]MDR7856162.1 stage II sporulation protein M [Tissierella sp.]